MHDPQSADDLPTRLASARTAAQAAATARQEAEEAVRAAARRLSPSGFTEARKRLSVARQRAEEAGAYLEALELAAAAEVAAEGRRRVEAAEVALAALAAEAAPLMDEYRRAALAVWQVAERVKRIKREAAGLHGEVREHWSNELAAELGRPCPCLGVELPDLTHLHLPDATPAGAALANDLGAEMAAADGWRRAASAARASRFNGVREGLRIARIAR